MNDAWGNDEDYARKAAAKHRRKKAAKRARARHRKSRGCAFGVAVAVPVGCVLWAAVLVPLILCC